MSRTNKTPVAFGQKQTGLRNTFNADHSNKAHKNNTGLSQLIECVLSKEFGRLPYGRKVTVKCCFHQSFLINTLEIDTETGAFNCSACNAEGSTIFEFYGMRKNMTNNRAYHTLMGGTAHYA